VTSTLLQQIRCPAATAPETADAANFAGGKGGACYTSAGQVYMPYNIGAGGAYMPVRVCLLVPFPSLPFHPSERREKKVKQTDSKLARVALLIVHFLLDCRIGRTKRARPDIGHHHPRLRNLIGREENRYIYIYI
jgi:hypothetical protein